MSEQRLRMLPIFRSVNQARILGCLFTEHDREWTGPELAGATGASPQTVSRELRSLAAAGLITLRLVGRTSHARAERDAAVFPELVRLMHKVYGPIPSLTAALSEVEGVQRAVIFGSWAARYTGQPGAFPRDVDVLVLGDPDPDEVFEACARAERAVGMPIQPTLYGPAAWEADTSAFAEQVRTAPQVELSLDRHPGQRG